MESTTVKVVSPNGFTGDTVNQLTNELSKFKTKIMLKYQGTTTIANSSLGVMSLGVPADATVQISVDGTPDDLQTVVDALVAGKFVTTL